MRRDRSLSYVKSIAALWTFYVNRENILCNIFQKWITSEISVWRQSAGGANGDGFDSSTFSFIQKLLDEWSAAVVACRKRETTDKRLVAFKEKRIWRKQKIANWLELSCLSSYCHFQQLLVFCSHNFSQTVYGCKTDVIQITVHYSQAQQQQSKTSVLQNILFAPHKTIINRIRRGSLVIELMHHARLRETINEKVQYELIFQRLHNHTPIIKSRSRRILNSIWEFKQEKISLEFHKPRQTRRISLLLIFLMIQKGREIFSSKKRNLNFNITM